MKRLVIAITTAWSVRNILLSGLAQRLSAELDIVLALPRGFPRSAELNRFKIEEFDVQESHDLRYLRIRERLGMAHMWRTNPVGAEYGRQLRSFRQPPFRKLVARVKHLRARWDSQPGRYHQLVATERALWEGGKNRAVGQVLERCRAGHFFSPVPHTRAEAILSRWASALGLQTSAMILSFDNLTTKGRHAILFDEYCVWNRQMQDELIAAYPEVPRERVSITGTPQFQFYEMPEFDGSREELCRRFDLDPRRPIITYATGPEVLVRHEVPVVNRFASDLAAHPRSAAAQLIVRLHPVDQDKERWSEIRNRNPAVKWSWPWTTDQNLIGAPERDDIRLLCLLMKHSDVVINCASTMSLDALVCGTPAICIDYALPPFADFAPHVHGFYDYPHYRPITESGAVPIARSPGQLLAHVLACLEDRNHGMPKREALLQKTFDDQNSGSTERLARRLVSFVENSRGETSRAAVISPVAELRS